MEDQVIHIKNRADFLVSDQLLKLKENQNRLTLMPVLVKESKKIATEKKIIENFEHLPNATKQLLKTQTQVYFSKLDKLGLTDYALLHEQSYQLSTLLLLIFLHPIFIFGWMTHSIPYGFGLFCGSKTKDVETRMSVVLGLTFGFYLLYYPFLMILGWIYGGWPILLLASMLPIFGYFSILYFDQARRYQAAVKVRQTASETVAELQKMRAEILSTIEL